MIAVGCLVGLILSVWADYLVRRERAYLQVHAPTRGTRIMQSACIVATTAGLFALLTQAELVWRWQDTPEVQPGSLGYSVRLVYHLALVCLLIVATVIDFDTCLIPDQITFPGMALGVVAAQFVTAMQLTHVWVDWNQAQPGLAGPYIPAWCDAYRNGHALAWTVTGCLVGMLLIAVVRSGSSWLLGQEAMGAGDVTLMGMIGAFIGWQAVTLVFVIAPVAGLLVALPLKWLFNRGHMPYGPCLAVATVIVLLFWGTLWSLTKTVFGDPISLLILATISGAALVGLLALLRLYRSIPTSAATTLQPAAEASPSTSVPTESPPTSL